MSHPNASDEIRRQAESKLLRHKQQLLFALPNTKEFSVQKQKISAEVQDLVGGIVLIQIPNELAWTLFIEAKNAVSVGQYKSFISTFATLTPQILEEYDLTVLTQFVRIFPDHPLAQIVAAYFTYQGIPLDEEDEEGVVKKKSGEDEEDYTSLILVSSSLWHYTESSSPDLGSLSQSSGIPPCSPYRSGSLSALRRVREHDKGCGGWSRTHSTPRATSRDQTRAVRRMTVKREFTFRTILKGAARVQRHPGERPRTFLRPEAPLACPPHHR